jgi:hypothetical protein
MVILMGFAVSVHLADCAAAFSPGSLGLVP